jgi:hypothetical protein
MFQSDMATVFKVLQEGIASPDDAAFVTSLASMQR